MLKALRITSILVGVLAVAIIASPAFFGSGIDEEAEKFLQKSSAIDDFKKSKGGRVKKSKSEVSPLVKEAQDFAKYLNPPAKPKSAKAKQRKKKSIGRGMPRMALGPKGDVSAKFDLIATSFYADHPELSLALINEPGKGFRWVRQSSKVGHLVIEQIKDGVIVIKDRQKTSELSVERVARKSLLRQPKTGKEESGSGELKSPNLTDVVSGRKKKQRPTSRKRTKKEQEEKDALMAKMLAQLMAKSDRDRAEDPDYNDVGDANFEQPRVSGEESDRLDELGKELADASSDPNQSKSRKIESSRKPSPLRRPRRPVGSRRRR